MALTDDRGGNSRRGTVVYIGGFSLPDRNAAAHRVVSNAKALRHLGYSVVLIETVLDSKEASTPTRLESYFGFDCWRVGPNRAFSGSAASLFSVSNVFRLLETYEDLELVIAYNYPAIALLRLLNYSRKRRVLCLADVTEWYGTRGRGLLYGIVKGGDTALRMKFVHKQLDGLIVVSSFLADYYQKQRTLLLPPLVDLSEPKWSLPQGPHADAEGRTRFVYAGSPSAEKERLDLIVAGVASLTNSHAVCLDIVGISRSEFESMYPHFDLNENPLDSDRLEFHGRMTHLEALRIVKRADFSLVIREESRVTQAGFPTKFVESITCGTPVVASEHPDVAKYLSGGGNGVITTLASLGSTLIGLLASPGRPVVERGLFDYRHYQGALRGFIDALK